MVSGTRAIERAVRSEPLVDECELIRRLRLDKRPNTYAQRRALDRLWRLAQNVRKDRKQLPLKRIKVGVRYLYAPATVDDLIESLSVAS